MLFEKTMKRLSKNHRDYRYLLAKNFVFVNSDMDPREKYTDVLAESWEFFKEHALQYRADVSVDHINKYFASNKFL